MPGNKHKMSEYSNSQIFRSFDHIQILNSLQSGKWKNFHPLAAILLQFYISIFNETRKQTQRNYYWVLKEQQRIVNLQRQRFLCLFPPLAALFGKGFSWGGNEIFGGIYFPFRKMFPAFWEFVKNSVGGWLVGEIFGGIISDISVHFVRCPLPAAKFKITPFFTLDGAKGTLSNRIFSPFYPSSSSSTQFQCWIVGKSSSRVENWVCPKMWRNVNCWIHRNPKGITACIYHIYLEHLINLLFVCCICLLCWWFSSDLEQLL